MTTTAEVQLEHLHRANELREQLLVIGGEFCDCAHRLEVLAHRLAGLEGELRAAEGAAGIRGSAGPTPRALAADVLFGAVSGLRPFVPSTTKVAAEQSEMALTTRTKPRTS